MKKILSLLMIAIIGLPSMAYQNYMLMTDHELSDVKVKDTNILNVNEIKSLNCQEHTMMITPINEGKTDITFKKGKRKIKMTVKVHENETYIKDRQGIKLVPVDLPMELK